MTRKELINSKDYIKTYVEAFVKDYKSKHYAIKKMTQFILRHRQEFLELNSAPQPDKINTP